MTPLMFLGWTIEDKRAAISAIQESLMTGSVVEAKTSNTNQTRFLQSVHPDIALERLAASIVSDPQFDATNAIDAACLAAQRQLVTRPNFL